MKHKYPVIFVTFTLCLFLTAVSVQAFSPTFIRGDVDASGTVDETDYTILYAYLMGGGQAPDCMLAADVNDDGIVNVVDPAVLQDYLDEAYTIPAPFPECGVDPTNPQPGTSCCFAEPTTIPSASPVGWFVLAFLLMVMGGTSIWLIRRRRAAAIRH
jgi:hypothetical protein